MDPFSNESSCSVKERLQLGPQQVESVFVQDKEFGYASSAKPTDWDECRVHLMNDLCVPQRDTIEMLSSERQDVPQNRQLMSTLIIGMLDIKLDRVELIHREPLPSYSAVHPAALMSGLAPRNAVHFYI